jgi:hypothetical protein
MTIKNKRASYQVGLNQNDYNQLRAQSSYIKANIKDYTNIMIEAKIEAFKCFLKYKDAEDIIKYLKDTIIRRSKEIIEKQKNKLNF